MKSLFKSYWKVVNRFIFTNIIIILGLIAAFVVFLTTIIQVNYDFTYNHNFNKDIYLYTLNSSKGDRDIFSMPETKDVANKIPEILNYCIFRYWVQNDIEYIKDNEEFTFPEINASQGFLSLFSPKIISGDATTAFTENGRLLITKSVARVLYGKDNPVGEILVNKSTGENSLIVAVCEDFPSNCFLKNGIYSKLEDDTDTHSSSYRVYIKTEFPGSVSQKVANENETITPVPLKNIHFSKYGKGNKNVTYTILFIGLIALIIAYINFINFSVSTAPSHVHNIKIQKLFGAKDRSIRFMCCTEPVLYSVVSLFIAFLLLNYLNSYLGKEIFYADMSFAANSQLLIMISLCVVLLGFLIGLYPAYYITSRKLNVSSSVNYSKSKSGTVLRNTLITFQFSASIILIIIAIYINRQNSYVANYSWGINTEDIIYLPIRRLNNSKEMPSFISELKRSPHIQGYTLASSIPGTIGTEMRRPIDGKSVTFAAWYVDDNFFNFFDIPIIEGEGFNAKIKDVSLIVNEEFLWKYEYDKEILNKKIVYLGEITGMAKNINFESLHNPIRPLMFIKNTENKGNWLFLKIDKTNFSETLGFINNTWSKFSDKNLDIKFLDATLRNLYAKENNISKMLNVFCIIIIIISIMGVYGLISFNIKQKEKEIALRKISGASFKDIIAMLSKNILIELIIALIVAVPIAYYFVNRWLDTFAYKLSFQLWIYISSWVFLSTITLITVYFKSYKAANKNPIEAIKTE